MWTPDQVFATRVTLVSDNALTHCCTFPLSHQHHQHHHRHHHSNLKDVLIVKKRTTTKSNMLDTNPTTRGSGGCHVGNNKKIKKKKSISRKTTITTAKQDPTMQIDQCIEQHRHQNADDDFCDDCDSCDDDIHYLVNMFQSRWDCSSPVRSGTNTKGDKSPTMYHRSSSITVPEQSNNNNNITTKVDVAPVCKRRLSNDNINNTMEQEQEHPQSQPSCCARSADIANDHDEVLKGTTNITTSSSSFPLPPQSLRAMFANARIITHNQSKNTTTSTTSTTGHSYGKLFLHSLDYLPPPTNGSEMETDQQYGQQQQHV